MRARGRAGGRPSSRPVGRPNGRPGERAGGRLGGRSGERVCGGWKGHDSGAAASKRPAGQTGGKQPSGSTVTQHSRGRHAAAAFGRRPSGRSEARGRQRYAERAGVSGRGGTGAACPRCRMRRCVEEGGGQGGGMPAGSQADGRRGREGGRSASQAGESRQILQRRVKAFPLALAPSAVRGRWEAARSGEHEGRRPELLDYARDGSGRRRRGSGA